MRGAKPFFCALLPRPPPAEAEDPRHRVRRRGRGGRLGRHASSRSATASSAKGSGAHAEYVCVRESGGARAQAGRHDLRGGGRGLRRRDQRAGVPPQGGGRPGHAHRSSTAPRDRSAPPPCSWPSTSAPTSPRVCNTKNVELVRSLGADEVDRLPAGGLHEERRDLRRHPRRGRQALVPALQALAQARRPLRRHRPRVHVAGPVPRAAGRRRIGDRRVMFADARYTKEDVLFLKELIEAGEYRPVIDRRTRWRTSSRRTGTSRRGRRPATSS